MGKPRLPNQKKQYQKLDERLAKYITLVEKLFDTANLEAAKAADITGFDPTGKKPFRWSDYPQTRKRIGDIQKNLSDGIQSIIYRGTSKEWTNSNTFQNLVAGKVLKTFQVEDRQGRKWDKYFQTNPDALKAFQKRKTGGMSLSQKVWNMTEQYRQELELALSVSIQKGLSANQLAGQIKKYLNEPDRLFRRVRDKYGNLVLSRNAKAYHPGQGVYRSSFRNARRLAASEINMAYRTAEQERWMQFDFVVGYEIKPGTNHKVKDICDDLAGKYPKDFVWTGWHPLCRDYKVAIVKTEREFWSDDRTTRSENEVRDVPDNFKTWIDGNIHRAKNWSSAPYFIRDNGKYIREDFKVDVYNKTEKAFVRKRRTNLAMSRVEYYNRTYPDIPEVQLAAVNAYTQAVGKDNKGATYREINRRLRNGTEDEYTETVSGLMSQCLKRMPVYEGMVFRGETMSAKRLQEQFLDHIGETVSDKGFISSSRYKDTPKKFISGDIPKSHRRVMFEIESKNGRDISKVSEFNGIFVPENQYEVLFDKRTKFLVKKRSIDNDGIYHIILIEQ